MQKDLLPFVLVTKKAKTGQFHKVTEAQRHWFLRGSCKWFLKIKNQTCFLLEGKLLPRLRITCNIKEEKNQWSFCQDLPPDQKSVNDMKNEMMHANILIMTISGK